MTEQENKEHVNHFLTLFIGECWHEPKIPGIKIRTLTCSLCGYEKELFDNKQWHFDFYTPNDFDRLRKWMEENEAEIWEEYLWYIIHWNIGNIGERCQLMTRGIKEFLNPSNLFEFLKDRREEWEWVDCQCCNGQGGFMAVEAEQSEMCRVCEGTGKVQHKAAVYLDSL